ncbi:hypothetical protein MPNT_400012 [Candidatus Methylacidithermus pantelleriae]|uniref:Uncharacterized protein n=1 Tax=Candidatus Methylacidithermus pantelleriae TaxID=2744239 RepID=A0A8J2FSY5_9BACT|nr:hypothetical protein MPNT_400012 [Candidatus Methylacidithermus pantelleriae]
MTSTLRDSALGPRDRFARTSENRFGLLLVLATEIESDRADSHALTEALRFGQGETILVHINAQRSGKAACHQRKQVASQRSPTPATPSGRGGSGSSSADPFGFRTSFRLLVGAVTIRLAERAWRIAS